MSAAASRTHWLREGPVPLWLLAGMTTALFAVWTSMAITAFGA